MVMVSTLILSRSYSSPSLYYRIITQALFPKVALICLRHGTNRPRSYSNFYFFGLYGDDPHPLRRQSVILIFALQSLQCMFVHFGLCIYRTSLFQDSQYRLNNYFLTGLSVVHNN